MDSEKIREQRTRFLGAVKIEQRAPLTQALDVLLEFSRQHTDALAPEPTDRLIQTSIGFELVDSDVLLWKAYARPEKLEVLPRSLRRLSDQDFEEFRALWHSIPGRSGQLEDRGIVPTISVKAVLTASVWAPVRECLEWGLRMTKQMRQKPSDRDLALDTVIDYLVAARLRATYGAVGGLIGHPPMFLMQGRPKNHRNSWIVSAETELPTGYAPSDCDPYLTTNPRVIHSEDELRAGMSI